ncbi:MAG: hypothetical protein KDK70_03910 [Myxococcales bacterium]|nr:hypothetical protein [Myxococcales bacterium]
MSTIVINHTRSTGLALLARCSMFLCLASAVGAGCSDGTGGSSTSGGEGSSSGGSEEASTGDAPQGSTTDETTSDTAGDDQTGPPPIDPGSGPWIWEVEGDVHTDPTITIVGARFGTKGAAAPLLWWKADGGTEPSVLGRKTAWDGPFGGVPSTAQVAPGSSQSIAFDHGDTSGSVLARVQFDSDELYIYRKFHEAFDVYDDVAIRTWVALDPGTTVNVGDTITGETSGAIGVVNHILAEDAEGLTTLYYDASPGTLSGEDPVHFQEDETMTGPGGSMVNREPFTPRNGSGPGVFNGFNYKIMRLWANFGQPGYTDCYLGAEGLYGKHFNMLFEFTDDTLWNDDLLEPIEQLPHQWVVDETMYRASSAPDVADGALGYLQNGILATDHAFVTRTAERPDPYDELYMSQVSGGAQLGSFIYYDALYVDESWHHVILCPHATIDACHTHRREVQIPTAWDDASITISVDLASLAGEPTVYLYVFDGEGLVNQQGFPL